jgi:hypothetical protein
MGGLYWIASYPKSGNTWFRAVLSNLKAGAQTPVHINEMTSGNIASSRYWIESVAGYELSDLDQDEIDVLRPHVYRWTAEHEDTGHYKIHDAYRLLPSSAPLIPTESTLGALYILRNPLDVALSYASHNHCSIDDAIMMMEDPGATLSTGKRRLHRQLRQIMGSWSDHVASWVDVPPFPIMTLRYEDMIANPLDSFASAMRFLGQPGDPEQLKRAISFSAFETLAGQEGENGFREKPVKAVRFFRKGKSGDWRDSLNLEQIARIIAGHGPMMQRFGYLDPDGQPV